MKPAMMTARDAALYLGVSLREVRRLVAAGELEVRYVGERKTHHYRILTSSADAYVASLSGTPSRA